MKPSDSTPHARSDEEQVAAAYRRARFAEEPPREVDQAILAEAARQRPRQIFTGWLTPVAVAATVLLSLSLVVRLGLIGPNGPDAEIGTFEAETLEENVADQPAGVPSGSARTLESTSASPPTRAGQAGQGVAGEGPDSPAPPATPARASSAAERSAPEALPQSLSLEAEEVVSAAPELNLQREQATCEEARDEPDMWLGCIARLRLDGAAGIARDELAAFRTSFPDYPVPDEMDDLAVP